MKKRGGTNTLLPLIMMGIGALLIVGVLVYVLVGQSPSPSAPAASSNSGQEIPYPEIKRVTLAEAKAAFDGKEVVIIDVRDADSYHAGHIPGSINVPLSLLESWDGKIDTGQWILTYCT